MRRFTPLLLLLPALVLVACGDTDAPSRPSGAASVAAVPDPGPGGRQGNLYPLRIGNRWTYDRLVRISAPGSDPQEIEGTLEREIHPPVMFQGREYLVIEEILGEDLGGGSEFFRSCILTRQDRNGLYEADRDVSDCGGAPASRAALYERILETRPMNRDRSAERRLAAKLAVVDGVLGGTGATTLPAGLDGVALAEQDGEITRLAYPLHPGQAWDIREEPRFASEVLGRARLVTPAGSFTVWRVSVTPPGLEEGDFVHMFYGRDGYLGHELFVTTASLKDPDDPVFFEETVTLTGLDLGGNGNRP